MLCIWARNRNQRVSENHNQQTFTCWYRPFSLQAIPHSFSRKANKLHGEQFCRKLPLMRKVREVKSNLVGKLFETCDKDWKKWKLKMERKFFWEWKKKTMYSIFEVQVTLFFYQSRNIVKRNNFLTWKKIEKERLFWSLSER